MSTHGALFWKATTSDKIPCTLLHHGYFHHGKIKCPWQRIVLKISDYKRKKKCCEVPSYWTSSKGWQKN
jgi:hypothetical protein